MIYWTRSTKKEIRSINFSIISLSWKFSSLVSASSSFSAWSIESTVSVPTSSLSISFESSTYFPVTGYFISSALVMYIESFSTRGQTTLTVIGISSQPSSKGEGLAFALWIVASNCAPSCIAYQVCWESSLRTCKTVIGSMQSFKRVLPATANLSCLLLYSRLKIQKLHKAVKRLQCNLDFMNKIEVQTWCCMLPTLVQLQSGARPIKIKNGWCLHILNLTYKLNIN